MLKRIGRIDITSELGMTTAEYAIGTVAAASFGGILLKILTSSGIEQILAKVIQQAFAFIFSLFS
ncbi:MAG: DUF4244 domain-containing protein [Actinobacteria bacterium]|nr:DUF4244 domain-containing protein [Actinomycetota bacterium]NBY14895.1 DUF4244 domain-containing protein [Actinomycetota bacterium]